MRSALMLCPECNNYCSLPHKVEANGDVNPSVVCPHEGCTFHKFVTLEGWPDGGTLPEDD